MSSRLTVTGVGRATHLMRATVRIASLLGAALVSACNEPAPGPLPPTLGDVDSPTSITVQAIVGVKQAATAIELSVNDGEAVIVPLDEETRFAAVVALKDGANELAAVAIDAAGRRSGAATAIILVDTAAPAAPTVDTVPLRTLRDELTVTGSVTPGDQVVVNGRSLALASGAASFAATIALGLGGNAVRIAARDVAGNESAVQDFVVERLAELPFTLAPPPALVNSDQLVAGALALTGTRGDGVEVTAAGVVLVAAEQPSGDWSASVAIVEGDNAFTVTGAFVGEPSSALAVDVVVDADLGDPSLTLSAPGATTLSNGAVTLAGTAGDARGSVQVSACVGACLDVAAFVPLTLVAGAFSGTIDVSISDDGAIEDGQLASVFVRALDAAGNDALLATSVLMFRAPITVAGLPGATSALDLAPDLVAGGALAWSNTAGAAGVALDAPSAGASDGWSPADVPLAAAGASSPRVARASSITHVVWVEADDLMYASDDGVAHLVESGATEPVLGADVTFDADDASGETALVAFRRADGVHTTSGSGSTWSAAVSISDATTSGATDVVVVDGGAAVAWIETSDRDGVLDDADVVLVSRAGAVPSAPVLVSVDQGSFVDAASSALCAALRADGQIAVAWLDGTRGVVAAVDLSGGAPVIAAPVEVTNVAGHGVASSIFIGTDILGGDDVLVGWLDDGAALLSGAAGPGLVVRRGPLASLGAPLVISTTPASSPVGFLAGPIAELAFIEGGDALLLAVELP